jgi:hypothetical protein
VALELQVPIVWAWAGHVVRQGFELSEAEEESWRLSKEMQ